MASPSSSKTEISLSPNIVIFTVALCLGIYFLYYIRSILTLLFLAFIVMVALNPLVTSLEKRIRLPRILSIVVVYLVVFLAIAGLFGLIIPPLSAELYGLLKTLNMPPTLQNELSNFKFTVAELSTLAERVGTSASVLLSIITSTFSGVFTFFTLMVISLYLMLDRHNLYKKVSWFSREPEHLKMAKDFLNSLENQLGGWVRGQVILMSLIGVVTYIGLSLLGVPYALPLAILAGLLEILPNIGPTIAAIPAVVLAFFGLGPVMAGVVAIFYVIIQQLENNIIVPKIMRDNVDVNPLVAIVTILIGLKLAGVVGALLAVPAYIVLRTVYSLWYKSRHGQVLPDLE